MQTNSERCRRFQTGQEDKRKSNISWVYESMGKNGLKSCTVQYGQPLTTCGYLNFTKDPVPQLQ